jgi:hypothetical protein
MRLDHGFHLINLFDFLILLLIVSPKVLRNLNISFECSSRVLYLRVVQILHQDMNDHHLMLITIPRMIRNETNMLC